MIEKTNPYTPMFITVDEFDNYWSVNLRDMLRTSANESNQAEMFLARVERRLMAYIDNNTFRRYKYEELCGKQLNAFKEAIVLQAMYVYKNGDIGMDSGYDAERGLVAKRAELVELSVCQDAIDVLANAGLWNMSMKNRPRKFGGDILYGLGLTGSESSGCCPSGGGSSGGGSGGGSSGGGGGTPGPAGPRGTSIESVTRITNPENTRSGEENTYKVLLENGLSAGTFTVYNGQKGADGKSFVITGEVSDASSLPDASEIALGTAYFVGATNPKDVYVVVNANGTKQWANEGKLEGPAGPAGPRGTSIASVTLNSASTVGGGSSVYNVNLEGGTVAGTFTVYNGTNGLPGAPGADGRNGTDGADGADAGFGTPTSNTHENGGSTSVTVTTDPSSPNTAKIFNFDFYNIKGAKGDKGDTGAKGDTGDTGATGNGISSITGPTTDGLVDRYTINMTDGSSKQFTVTNAKSITGVERRGQNNLNVTYRIAFNSGNPFDYVVTNGNGITGITGPTQNGLEDTYTIHTNVDGPYTFTVKNGIMSAAQFGYGTQKRYFTRATASAGNVFVDVSIPSNVFPISVYAFDEAMSNSGASSYENVLGWQRTSSTNVRVCVMASRAYDGSAVDYDRDNTLDVNVICADLTMTVGS